MDNLICFPRIFWLSYQEKYLKNDIFELLMLFANEAYMDMYFHLPMLAFSHER